MPTVSPAMAPPLMLLLSLLETSVAVETGVGVVRVLDTVDRVTGILVVVGKAGGVGVVVDIVMEGSGNGLTTEVAGRGRAMLP